MGTKTRLGQGHEQLLGQGQEQGLRQRETKKAEEKVVTRTGKITSKGLGTGRKQGQEQGWEKICAMNKNED